MSILTPGTCRPNTSANEFRVHPIIRLAQEQLKTGRVCLQIGGWHTIVCKPALKK